MSAPETKDMIGGIDVTAPLWNKTEPRELHTIVAALSDASYHYADDSGKEWSAGNGAVQRAAKAVNAAGLGHYAITCLHRHTSQLVTLDRFMDAILKDARPASPDLSDPIAVHANMLRGTIAKPMIEQIIHIYGVDALCAALAPKIVREAEEQAAPVRVVGLIKAVEALGAMPEGYCFCSKNRIGDDSKTHEPECRDLRAALKDAK